MLALALTWRWLPGWARSQSFADELAESMDGELGGRRPVETDLLTLEAPDIAENGAIVPITVKTGLPGVDAIWVFVEKNPTPLAARFELEKSLEPYVSLRIKMNESSDVIAVVRSDREYFSACQKVRVVVGGCG